MRKFLIIAFIVIFLTVATGAVLALKFIDMGKAVGDDKTIIYNIERGKTLRDIAAELENNGVIKNAWFLSWIGKQKGLAHKIQAGEYEI